MVTESRNRLKKLIMTQAHKMKKITGVLLVNLGSPQAPTKKAVRHYLKEFLSDPRVVAIPKFIWWFILRLVVLPFRPKRSAKLYQKIWTEHGSPLVHTTSLQTDLLRKKFQSNEIQIEYAMRYGQPSIQQSLKTFADQHLEKLIVLPLYPQYCQSTTASTFDAIAEAFKKNKWLPELNFINHYADDPNYIDALAHSIQNYFTEHGKPEKLAISFHGIPKQALEWGDPYYCFCHKTTRLLTEKLGLSEDEYTLCFQSRFGPTEWLKPYTSDVLSDWAKQNVKHIAVVCPGFSADCLETLEEINIQYRELFLTEGGERFDYIPALNTDESHITMMQRLVESRLTNVAKLK